MIRYCCRTVPVLILSISLVAGIVAGQYSVCVASRQTEMLKAKAKDLYYGLRGKKNQSQALQLYLEAGQLGDAEALFIAGGMYFKGIGTTKDYSRAFALLHKAAQMGVSSPESQLILAQGYFLGKEIPRNYKKAVSLYKEAAANGNPEAQNELGFLYFLGRGVEQDAAKGAEYFHEAALNGLSTAQYNYGLACYYGNGVKDQDAAKGYAWINVAAAQGHPQAISARDYIETQLSEDELRRAHEITAEIERAIEDSNK